MSRTTLMIEDALLREIKKKAGAEGRTRQLVDKALDNKGRVRVTHRAPP